MKNAIKEYLGPTDSEKQDLLKTAIIVFDTNVFLNLYRYSKPTRDALIQIMVSCKDRLWMPYQVAKEFMKKRPEVILETMNKYEGMVSAGEKLVQEFANCLRIKQSDESCEELKSTISNWVDNKKNINLEVTSCNEDTILAQILELFDGKVGSEFDDEMIGKIKKEGKERYAKKIPPGYMDSKKISGDDDNNAYGDLIFWLQLLDYAKDNSVDIILVTDDQKEDWWQILHGKTIGPRPELKKEFYSKTHRNFHMYTMKQFIEYSGYNKDEELTCKIEEEVAPKSMPIAEIGLIGLGYKRGTLEMLEQELFELTEKNERRFETLEGYKNLLVNDSITPKQIQEMKNTMAAYKRDGERIKELREKIRNLTIIGLGNL